MSLVQHTGATVAHVIHPSAYRAAVLGRRIRTSASVSALISEPAYGAVHREQADALPSSLGRARP